MKDLHNKQIGFLGEEHASKYYQSLGYFIKDRNFRTPMGELDIIAVKDKKLYFIEVKTRVGDYLGTPWEQINKYKIRHLKRAIYYYCKANNISLEKQGLSIHVCSVLMNDNLTIKKIKQRPLEFSDL